MRQNDAPFVSCFQTEKCRYIYDVNTNRVFQVDEVLHTIIKDFKEGACDDLAVKYRGKFSEEEIRNAYNEIGSAREDGIFLSKRPERMSLGIDPEKALAGNTCEQIILNVTESCNLRCAYCVFSGCYEGHRPHSGETMSLETAKKAIDYLLENSSEKVNVAFYGGEPLLAFSLIKEVVNYAKSRSAKQTSFSMTTNGTLLNEDIIGFLIENDFLVTVSLDGPEEVHDRYRKDVGGSGTYRLITANLEKLKERNEEYYRTRVVFSVVNAPPYRLNTTLQYFTESSLGNKNNINASFLSRSKNNFLDSIAMDERGRQEGDFNLIYDTYRRSMLAKETVPPFVHSMVERYMLQIYERVKCGFDEACLNGCCVPGMRRQFVDMDGSIYVCEKMGCSYPIGDIYNGLDNTKIRELISRYIEISSDCLDCWACRLCSICYATCLSGGSLCGNRKKEECAAVKKRFGDIIKLYYTLVESEPNIFDYLAPNGEK